LNLYSAVEIAAEAVAKIIGIRNGRLCGGLSL
jgi:hypothetical protein